MNPFRFLTSTVREFVDRVTDGEPIIETFLNLTVPYRARALVAEGELDELREAIENDAPDGAQFFRLIEDEHGNKHLGYMTNPFESVSHPHLDFEDVDTPGAASVFQYIFDEDSERVEYQHVGYFVRELPE